MYFSKNIKYLRESANLSQEKLGELFSLADTTISNWEKGRSTPNIAVLIALCKHFNTDPTTLLYTDISVLGVAGARVELMGGAKEVQDEVTPVPLYGTVSAGASGLAAFWEREQPVGWVAAKEFEGCLAAFRVVGESMEPEIKSGDMVFIRSFDKGSYYSPQSIYMIVTREERMIKRVRIAPDAADVLICSSPNYQEFRLPITEVLAVYKVAGFVRVV
ncbi:helix-turn-helix domain-containing protein [Sphingobacteriales bacterium UPWRP_1]|nr:hypothetical protein BVG80_17350 [Sphingobacteriales bacterium TSM_CSM]PSJ74200.1 helix-turn-helix domain-containing protein [Sphingobacteriales bacterium UPWRP_1]